MTNTKKKAGRPKLINRDEVINIAFHLYWEHGVENVSMSSIAKKANIDRAGLYKEFDGEDNLIQECLNLYKETFQLPMLNTIDDTSDLPSVIKVLFDAIIYDGQINFDKLNIELPESTEDPPERANNAAGCFYLRTKIANTKLSNSHIKYTQLYDKEVIRRLSLCIEGAKKKNKAYDHVDPTKTAEFINAQIFLMQSLRSSQTSEEKMLDIYNMIVATIIPEKYRL